jgi:catechol 2,3-dioxygenase-like lactoylglutathione lyase family enzyme
VLGHVGINVSDLGAARRYYSAIMPRVGFERYLDADDEFAYRPLAGKPGTYLFFYPSAEQSRYSRHQTGLQHPAFMVRIRSAVRAVFSAVAQTRRVVWRAGAARAAGDSSIPAAVFRDVLARPLGRHARSGMPSGPRLTIRDEIRCADRVRPTVPV